MNKLNVTYFNSLKNELKLQISKDINWLSKHKEDFNLNSEFIQFVSQVKKLKIDDNNYAFCVYFLNAISKIIRVVELTNEALEDEFLGEEIAEFWSQTDVAEIYFSNYDVLECPIKSSLEVLEHYLQRTMAFFYLHISHDGHVFYEMLPYPFLPNLGDSQDGVYIASTHFFKMNNCHENNLFIKSISKDKSLAIFVSHGKEIEINSQKRHAQVYSQFHAWTLIPTDETKNHFTKLINRSQLALDLLHTIDPYLVNILEIGTRFVIPMYENNIVSYSMQDLPLYSSINYDFRNFIDHLDDLLHENGHHLLNLKLNTQELVIVDNEQDYFSPWRRSLRPARGLYHAFITFYWAHSLFRRMYLFALNLEANGTHIEEFDYICKRYIEENILLKACVLVLGECLEDNKISIEGEDYLNYYIDQFNFESDLIDSAKLVLEVTNSKMLKDVSEVEQFMARELKYFHEIEWV